MIYTCQNPILNINSVEHMQWSAGDFTVEPRDFSAIAFRIRGDATIVADNQTYFVDNGDILYLPQGLAYEARYSDTEMIAIHFITQRPDPAPQIFSPSNIQQVYKAFLTLHTLWKNKAPGYTAYCTAQLYNILGQLCQQDTVTKLPEYFLQAVSYIHDHYTDHEISIPVICKNAGISPTYLRILFQL
jgi:hypothetical protein